ncbi:MAG: hypothetical protein LC793_04550 [Thermomicrobia bacterium]|nr:hypothetical protein [Thermomicrobia bacterium]MCA1724640.1 hypothetical protein [Thermomicrobia bacterium]
MTVFVDSQTIAHFGSIEVAFSNAIQWENYDFRKQLFASIPVPESKESAETKKRRIWAK